MNSSARYSRNRTRFVIPPSELDLNSQNPLLVNAALTAGLYPKILSIDRKNGLLHTISNNQRAYLHPSSVNFGKNVMDFGVNHLAYFTLMYVTGYEIFIDSNKYHNRHSKKLYAWETGPVDDLAMLLLCGEYDSKVCIIYTIF
jgi:ATP-dependent RNA helicase DHX29